MKFSLKLILLTFGIITVAMLLVTLITLYTISKDAEDKAFASLKKRTELAKLEIEKLNKITSRINSVYILTNVMTFIMYHLETEYKFKDQKMLYLPIEENNNLSPIDKQIVEQGKFSFLLQIPFVIYGETIGILCLHNKELEIISNDLLNKLQTFSNQVAGSVSNSKLYKQAQEAREEAEIERDKSEKLLLNILPKDVAFELKEKGFTEPVLFENVEYSKDGDGRVPNEKFWAVYSML
jgi:transcriptional regulator with GAF, ATPase, and Fis domain